MHACRVGNLSQPIRITIQISLCTGSQGGYRAKKKKKKIGERCAVCIPLRSLLTGHIQDLGNDYVISTEFLQSFLRRCFSVVTSRGTVKDVCLHLKDKGWIISTYFDWKGLYIDGNSLQIFVCLLVYCRYQVYFRLLQAS